MYEMFELTRSRIRDAAFRVGCGCEKAAARALRCASGRPGQLLEVSDLSRLDNERNERVLRKERQQLTRKGEIGRAHV